MLVWCCGGGVMVWCPSVVLVWLGGAEVIRYSHVVLVWCDDVVVRM